MVEVLSIQGTTSLGVCPEVKFGTNMYLLGQTDLVLWCFGVSKSCVQVRIAYSLSRTVDVRYFHVGVFTTVRRNIFLCVCGVDPVSEIVNVIDHLLSFLMWHRSKHAPSERSDQPGQSSTSTASSIFMRNTKVGCTCVHTCKWMCTLVYALNYLPQNASDVLYVRLSLRKSAWSWTR